MTPLVFGSGAPPGRPRSRPHRAFQVVSTRADRSPGTPARNSPFAKSSVRLSLKLAKPSRLERKFACRIKLICPVQIPREKYSA